MTRQKLWHIILMVGGALAVLAPDLTGLAASLAGMGIGWLNWVARVLGVLALIGSRWDVIRGKLAPLLIEDRTKLGPPSSGTPVVCLLILGSLLLAGQAQAQPRTVQALGCIDAANTYCVVPAAAVGWQVNLKTGGVANAVSLVGLTLQHTFGTLPVGLGVYAGLGMSTANQGSQQACLGASITNWGLLCGGVQRATFPGGGTALQGMLTFAPQLTFGGTPAYVQGAR